MADRPFISIETNEDEVLRQLDLSIKAYRSGTHDLIDDLAVAGKRLLEIKVPQHSSYLLRHIDRSRVSHTPSAGVDEWSAIVGIKRGTSNHPFYVEFGTGLYATPSRGFIRPNSGQFMSFFSTLYGRRIKVRQVKGQRAQRYFYNTWIDLQFYASARILSKKLI